MLSVLELSSSNVGQIAGDSAKGVIKRICIFGGKFTSAQTVDATALQTALADASKLSKTDQQKFYMLPEVLNFEDRSEQNTTGALNLGPTVMLKEGKTSYEVRVSGSSQYCKSLRRWNNLIVGIAEIDSNNKMWGRAVGTDWYGYTAQIFVNQMRVASGQAPEENIVTITVSFLSSDEYGNQSKALDLSLVDTSLIKTQNDAIMSVAAANSSNTWKIAIKIPLGIHNKYFDCVTKFTTAWNAASNASALVQAANNATGAAINITSIAYNASGYLDIVLDTTAYAALASGDKIRLYGRAPATMESANVTDIELVDLVITKP